MSRKFVFFILFLSSQLLFAAQYERFEENGKVGLKDNQGKIILPAAFDELGWSDGNFSVINQITGYRQKNKWGLLNLRKEFITKAEFETITCPGGDRAIVSKSVTPFNNRFGCIDLQGKLIIPFFYDAISLNGLRAIVMIKNGARYEYGLVDLDNKPILHVRYREITPIGSLRYAVEDFSNKKALCSEDGKWITDFVIDAISPFQFDLAIIKKEWRQGVIDRNGDIRIEPSYREILITGPNQIKVRKADEWKLMDIGHHDLKKLEADELTLKAAGWNQIRRDGKYGLVDENFQLKWPLSYNYIGAIENNQVVVKKDGAYSLLRMDQTAVLPITFDSLCVNGNFIRAQKKLAGKSSWELYDTFGIRKTRSAYEFMGGFNEKFFFVKNRGFWGAVDRYGTERIACVYDSILQLQGQLVAVRFKGQYGIITEGDEWRLLPQKNPIKLLDEDHFLEWSDSLCFLKDFTGNAIYFTDNPLHIYPEHLLEVLPDGTQKEINFSGRIISRTEPVVRSEERALPESEGLIGIRRDGKFGFVDQRGRLRIANRYEDIGAFHHGLAPVKLLGRWGFINTADEIVIQPTYESIENFDHEIAIVSSGGKFGLIGADGAVKLSLRYDSIQRLTEQFFLLTQNSQKGLADMQGRILIEPRFEQLSVISDLHVIVKQNGLYGLLTTDGLSIFPIHYHALTYQRDQDLFLAELKSVWETVEIK